MSAPSLDQELQRGFLRTLPPGTVPGLEELTSHDFWHFVMKQVGGANEPRSLPCMCVRVCACAWRGVRVPRTQLPAPPLCGQPGALSVAANRTLYCRLRLRFPTRTSSASASRGCSVVGGWGGAEGGGRGEGGFEYMLGGQVAGRLVRVQFLSSHVRAPGGGGEGEGPGEGQEVCPILP